MPLVTGPKRALPGIKPAFGASLNRGHPLSQGLVACFLLQEAGGYDLTNSAPVPLASVTFSGTKPTWGFGADGAYLQFSATLNEAHITPALSNWGLTQNAVGNNITLALSCMWTTATSTNALVLGDAVSNQLYSIGWSTTLNAFAAQQEDNTSTQNRSGNGVTPVINTRYFIVGQFSAGGPLLVWVNGAPGTGATAPSLANVPVSTMYIGGTANAGAMPGRVFSAFMWTRTLSNSEVQCLSQDPYQMFVPTPRLFGGLTFKWQQLVDPMSGHPRELLQRPEVVGY